MVLTMLTKMSASKLRRPAPADTISWLANMTVTEYRAFRKALAVLTRAGVTRDDAIGMLHTAAVNRYNFGSVE